ncbi:GNAT family N-acetyltransferase [Lacticigenium naphthae]|uniref:GNAT family N-acetyltransferase n=1 Tax=Lacticigenium naphthae TaxID=515351 RepID=UPI000424A4D9|nr:GNAT family protein [Lacticigenium naphthae]
MTSKWTRLAENTHIETERLLLRPVTMEDAEAMFEYASDEETAYYVFEKHGTLADTKDAIAHHFMQHPLGKYGIELKSENKLIGTIEIRLKGKHHRGELGYVMNPGYQRKGYVTEAAAAIVRVGFEEFGLERIYAMFDDRNEPSKKVLERIGMQHEGVMRHVEKWKQGEWANDVYYSILKDEYFAQRND